MFLRLLKNGLNHQLHGGHEHDDEQEAGHAGNDHGPCLLLAAEQEHKQECVAACKTDGADHEEFQYKKQDGLKKAESFEEQKEGDSTACQNDGNQAGEDKPQILPQGEQPGEGLVDQSGSQTCRNHRHRDADDEFLWSLPPPPDFAGQPCGDKPDKPEPFVNNNGKNTFRQFLKDIGTGKNALDGMVIDRLPADGADELDCDFVKGVAKGQQLDQVGDDFAESTQRFDERKNHSGNDKDHHQYGG